MNNLSLLEVLVKNVSSKSYSESEYDTPVDIINSFITEETYLLQLDIYKGYFIEITRTHITSSRSVILPECNFIEVSSDSASKKSEWINACCYRYKNECEFKLEISSKDLIQIINAIEHKSNQTIMIPFPRDVIKEVFDNAFQSWLDNAIEDWKREIAA